MATGSVEPRIAHEAAAAVVVTPPHAYRSVIYKKMKGPRLMRSELTATQPADSRSNVDLVLG